MSGYKVATIVGIDLSSVPLVVSFEDTHGHHFSLPCTCPQFRELTCGSSTAQLIEILNQCTMAVIIHGGVIRKFSIEPTPVSEHSEPPAATAPSEGRAQFPHPTGAATKEPDAKRDHPDVYAEMPPTQATRPYAAEGYLYEASREVQRRISASPMMYCDHCKCNVRVGQKKRGQFRRQSYCSRCGEVLETTDYED